MADAPALVSVLIPTFNRQEALRQALAALDAQTAAGRPFEVIVVDDGSTDGTARYLQAAAFSFPLRLLTQGRQGPAAARNAGLSAAAGDTVLFLNDDTLAAPDLLEQHRDYRRRHGECAVLGRIEWAAASNLAPEVLELAQEYYFPYHQIADPDDVSFTFFITGNLAAPVQWVRQVGGFDERFREAAFEDVELGYRLQCAGLKLKYHPAALASHLHPLDFDSLCDRQYKVAYWLYAMIAKHPEALAFYPGLDAFAGQFPVTKRDCLRVVLSYVGHRGLKAGRQAFMDGPQEKG